MFRKLQPYCALVKPLGGHGAYKLPTQVRQTAPHQRETSFNGARQPRPPRLINSRLRPLIKQLTASIVTLALVVACHSDTQLQNDQAITDKKPTETNVLRIWWDKGYYPEEDEALRNVVNNWQQQTNNQVKLSFYTNDELALKTQRAIQAGDPPDILMNDGGDRTIGSLAWKGKLADVSQVIEPVRNIYDDTMLSSVYFYNQVEQERNYYAVPIHVSIPHILIGRIY